MLKGAESSQRNEQDEEPEMEVQYFTIEATGLMIRLFERRLHLCKYQHSFPVAQQTAVAFIPRWSNITAQCRH